MKFLSKHTQKTNLALVLILLAGSNLFWINIFVLNNFIFGLIIQWFGCKAQKFQERHKVATAMDRQILVEAMLKSRIQLKVQI